MANHAALPELRLGLAQEQTASDDALRPRGRRAADPADLADIGRCLKGDGDAYRRLIERHQKQISGMMWRFSRDPDVHEELVQDVFVQAYESLTNYRAEAPFAHWLARIATRVGYAYWKKQKREQAIETVPLEDWHHIPDETTDEMSPEAAGEMLHQLLAKLPPRDRLVLTLRHVDERSVEETAELTGWSVSMVKVQAWRARKKLKALFERCDEAGDRM